jgi:tetratricopeptide (TPR) repeat protein
MPLLSRALLPLALAGSLFAQFPGLTLPPSGNNQKASITQFIGPVRVTIEYSSPAVHGPGGDQDRRGKIWGKLVPYGLSTDSFGNGKPDPWRAGANENTVFAVSDDLTIEGQALPKGRYGLHMIPGEDTWTLVFSKDSKAWGSFFYDPSHDALRVTAKPHKNEYREWLTYDFVARRPEEATVEMQWEDMALPWNIKVPNTADLYISRLREELTSVPGFSYQGYLAAIGYCLQVGKNLDQALEWADAAIGMPYVGQANFQTLSTKARVLAKLGREAEAKPIMQAALHSPATTPIEIHQYGRQLLGEKKIDEAMQVFEYNAARNGDAWPVHVGLARGYAAKGDTKQALEHARKALPQAPDDQNRKILEAMIDSLAKGAPIN